jgi:AmmeMemoRadiSam system protein A
MSDVLLGKALGAEERDALVRFARLSIRAALTGGRKPERPEGPGLEDERGAFVTLRRRADAVLRGCVGLVRADRPLVDVVADVGVAAALRDDRFPPVVAEELPSLSIEISVLGPTFPVRPEEIALGEMGLLIRGRGRQGLLLPQVSREQGWDRDTFLERTCLKAGLGASAWREATTEIHAFRCVAFGD